MNTIENTKTEYLRANRTIETVRVSRGDCSKKLFVFNYEGVHYRVFENIMDAYEVASGDTSVEVLAEFTKESALDDFLEKELQF